jgi:hypothetical protein
MIWLRLHLVVACLGALAACAGAAPPTPEPAGPAPTPTLLGTADPPKPAQAPATPRPSICIFRTGPSDEAGVYRFDWQNATLTLSTKIGPLIVDGPRNLAPGPRQLVLLHNFHFDDPGSVNINFAPGGTLIDDPGRGVQEVRDPGGTLVSQAWTDPVGDAGGLPAYLDIVRVERSFGYYPNSLVRVYLAGIHSGPFIWNFQSVSVIVGGVTFTQQSYYDNRIALSQTDSQGRTSSWAGPVTVGGNVFSFPLEIGVDQPVSASTATSSGGGDVAGPYPQDFMQKYWQAASQKCP